MAEHPTLIRKRLIPLETLRLEKDVIVHQSDRLLVTRWTTIKPKKPYTTDGMPASRLTAGRIIFFARLPAISVIKQAASTPTTDPISTLSTPVSSEETIIGAMPN